MFRQKAIKGALATILALGLGLGNVPSVLATTFEGEKTTEMLKFGGDMRLRSENFYYTAPGVKDASRQRFRLRFGVTANVEDFIVGFRLASGTGEQVSTNQTEGNVFNQKSIWIDQAYVTWKAIDHLKLTGGKMQNPFWTNYSSDLVWDADVNPEGYAEQVDMPLTDRLGMFANFGQMPVADGSSLTAGFSNPWLFGNQIGLITKVDEDTKITTAGSFYNLQNPRSGPFVAAPATQQQGNSRVGSTSQLATGMKTLLFSGELATHAGPLPVSLQGDFVHNSDDAQRAGMNGYQTGAVVGKAKNAKTWEAAYFYKYSQFNSTLADISDSDFGNKGGTNRKGHIFWIAYAPKDFVQIKAKYFITEVINPFIANNGLSSPTITSNNTGNYGNVNRLQLDVVVKF
jgi:hypothetical protein